MVTLRRFNELREFSIAPVIITCIYYDTADCSTMSADPFCSRLNHDVCSPFDRTEEVTCCTESIINYEGQIIFFCQLGKLLEIRNVEAWVTDRFKVDGLCIFVDMLYKTFDIIAICKACFDTEAFE